MLRYADYDIVFQEIPDETTLAINLSNCPNRCRGCHSPQLWDDIGTELAEQDLLDLLTIYGNAITCVCFMGGDAFPFEVEKQATFLQNQTVAKVKVGWYSGKQDLPAGLSLTAFQYIKLGPYLEQSGSLKSRETNQRLYRIEKGQMVDITAWYWK